MSLSPRQRDQLAGIKADAAQPLARLRQLQRLMDIYGMPEEFQRLGTLIEQLEQWQRGEGGPSK